MRTSLITADLHVTDKTIDADRWNLFPWIRQQIRKHDIGTLFLLGDLTDAKDRHPSNLVNRLVREIHEITLTGCYVYIIPGNHDFIDENSPFFQFLQKLPSVSFWTKPKAMGKWLLLPHTKDWQNDWSEFDFKDFEVIFCHQTFEGAVAENGVELRGIPPGVFKGFRGRVVSGDVHVPQDVSKIITYVGAPYRVHFGDAFTPRCLLMRGSTFTDLHYPGKNREVIVIRNLRDLQETDLVMGTQVKVRAKLKRTEYADWASLKKDIRRVAGEKGWELCALELSPLKTTEREVDEREYLEVVPEQVLETYAKQKKLPKELFKAGLEFLKEVQ